jgi:hypothetical protein
VRPGEHDEVHEAQPGQAEGEDEAQRMEAGLQWQRQRSENRHQAGHDADPLPPAEVVLVRRGVGDRDQANPQIARSPSPRPAARARPHLRIVRRPSPEERPWPMSFTWTAGL